VSRSLQVEPHDLGPALLVLLEPVLLALRLAVLELLPLAGVQQVRVVHVLQVVDHDDGVALFLLRIRPLLHALLDLGQGLLVDDGKVVDDEELVVRDGEGEVEQEALGGLLVLEAGVRDLLDGRVHAGRVEQDEVFGADLDVLEAEPLGGVLLAREEGGACDFVEDHRFAFVLEADHADDGPVLYDFFRLVVENRVLTRPLDFEALVFEV